MYIGRRKIIEKRIGSKLVLKIMLNNKDITPDLSRESKHSG